MARNRHALWLDIRRSIRHSKGRFLSIVGLMALGSFALVGLFVAGPDMRATGRAYFDALDAADILVIGDFGLNEEGCALIEQAEGIDEVEYGYLKDAVVAGTTDSYRIQSLPERVSRYEVVEGRLPQASGEIALDSFSQGEYAIGDTVTFDEKPDTQGDTVLARDTFTVVGFVSSSEIISGVNMGASTAGSGELSGYAVVVPETFDSDVYMTARLTFADTAGVDPYTDTYADLVHAHRDDLEDLLAGQPGVRLAALRAEKQATIDDGQAEVDAGYAELADAETELSDARSQLDEGAVQIAVNEQRLESETTEASSKLADGAAQIAAGREQLEAAQEAYDEKAAELAAAQQQIADGQAQLAAAQEEYAAREAAYEEAFGETYAPNAALVTLADSSAASVNALAAHLMELPAVQGIVQNTSLMAQIATIVESLNKIMVVLIVVATLLAGVILYNLTTINISERIRELSTIKVLGFFDGEVTMYIYRETMLLTLIGIVVGWGLGVLFRNYIITVVPPDNVMFDPAFAPYVFIIPLVIVGALTVLLGVVVNRRLRNVDMLEALKSVE